MNSMVFDGFGGMGVWLSIGGGLVHIICRVLAGPCICMCWGGMCIVLTILGL